MTTKVCIGCSRDLSLELFSFKDKNRGVLQSRCKICYNEYNREYYQKGERLKQLTRVRNNQKKHAGRYKDWKTGQSCVVCGEDSSECIDLHHVDPSVKEGTISQMINRWSWDRIQEEIKKCIIVCSNCHRKIHSGRIESPVSSVGLEQ